MRNSPETSSSGQRSSMTRRSTPSPRATTVTGALADGTVVFGGDELDTTTLTRMPVQGPEMGGMPIDGLVGVPAASPEATPAS